MKNREIESKINRAFSRATPEFSEDLLKKCSFEKGTVIAMTTPKTERKISKSVKIGIVAVAAAAVLTVTAAAVGLGGLIPEEQALIAAKNYAVMTENDPELEQALGGAIIAGRTYGESVEQGEANLGLKDGRLVYHARFKTCGYAFEAVVDAKTGVVYSCEKAVDPDWNEVKEQVEADAAERLERKNDKTLSEIAQEKINSGEFETRFKRHFALYRGAAIPLEAELTKDDRIEITVSEDGDTVEVSKKLEGYVYAAEIDVRTSEILSSGISDDPDFIGERVRFELPEGALTYDEAEELAIKYINEKYPELRAFSETVSEPMAHSFAYLGASFGEFENGYDVTVSYYGNDAATGELTDRNIDVYIDGFSGELDGIVGRYGLQAAGEAAAKACTLDHIDDRRGCSDENDSDRYICRFTDRAAGRCEIVAIDLRTLDILSVEQYDISEIEAQGEPARNDIPSSEAEDGMISEAAAASIVLESMGLSQNDVNALRVELDGDVYEVTFNYGWADREAGIYQAHSFEVDAKTGELIDGR